jgi:hypothetical protein
VNTLVYLFKALGLYLLIQVILLFVMNSLPKPELINHVRRSVYVGLMNHVFFIIAGVYGATFSLEAAKINNTGIWWIIPLGIFLGFVYFLITEVASRLIRRNSVETLLDLQLYAITPVMPRNVLIPGLINYLALKPLGEELFFRAFAIGVLSTQIHLSIAVLIVVILENLRYPQVSWFPRNTIKALLLAALFIFSPSVLLPLSVSVTCGVLTAINQISKVRNALEKITENRTESINSHKL